MNKLEKEIADLEGKLKMIKDTIVKLENQKIITLTRIHEVKKEMKNEKSKRRDPTRNFSN